MMTDDGSILFLTDAPTFLPPKKLYFQFPLVPLEFFMSKLTMPKK